MRILKKLGPDKYAEFDDESNRQLTVEMTREEAYSYRLKFQVDDLASWAVESADIEFSRKESST